MTIRTVHTHYDIVSTAVTQGFYTNDISVWIKKRKVYFRRYCHRREKFTSVTVIIVSYI